VSSFPQNSLINFADFDEGYAGRLLLHSNPWDRTAYVLQLNRWVCCSRKTASFFRTLARHLHQFSSLRAFTYATPICEFYPKIWHSLGRLITSQRPGTQPIAPPYQRSCLAIDCDDFQYIAFSSSSDWRWDGHYSYSKRH
jgi:hypothetical protein